MTTVTGYDHPKATRRSKRSSSRSRLRFIDLIATGLLGLTTRVGRTVLTAGGIAIGIASMVSVMGISSSSRADVLAELDRLGTNLLAVQPGNSLFGDEVTLPDNASARIRRIPATQNAASLTAVQADIVRSDVMPPGRNGGMQVSATEPQLLDTLAGTMTSGRFLTDLDRELPTVVLGSDAADFFGIRSVENRPTILIGEERFAVVGVMDSLVLYPDVDRMALIGYGVAEKLFDTKPAPSTVYLRADPEFVEPVREILGRTVDPESPNSVNITRPSESLSAKAEVNKNLTNMLLGLGAVALVVGGVGIANVMVISVLERRNEIGVRRALGATRRHIAAQFVVESATLATIGGAVGVGLGAAVTVFYAKSQEWTIDVPIESLGLGIAAALIIGALAGLYPAIRAARLDPAEAVRPA